VYIAAAAAAAAAACEHVITQPPDHVSGLCSRAFRHHIFSAVAPKYSHVELPTSLFVNNTSICLNVAAVAVGLISWHRSRNRIS